MRLFEKHTPKTRTNHKVLEESRLLRCRAEGTSLCVHLDYSPGVVQHADNCALRAKVGAILCVRDCLTDRIGPCIPDRAVSKQLTDQIKAISVLARTNLVNVVAPQPQAPLFGIHGFHTCYLFLLSFKRIWRIKSDNSVTFVRKRPVALQAFREDGLVL